MANKEIPYKIYLEENEMPKAWYNLRADMINKPAPLLHPETHEKMTAADLAGVFCDELIRQELDTETAYFEIPQEILDGTATVTFTGILTKYKGEAQFTLIDLSGVKKADGTPWYN